MLTISDQYFSGKYLLTDLCQMDFIRADVQVTEAFTS
jgi:hypothetical protein